MTEPQDSTPTCTVSRDTLPSKCPERAVKILRSHGALVQVPENVRRGEVVWSGHAVCAFHEHRYEVRTVRSVSTLHEITPKDGTEPYLRPRYAAPVDAHLARARHLGADAALAAAASLTMSESDAVDFLDGDGSHDLRERYLSDAEPNLSGEWADDPTPDSIAREVGVEPYPVNPDDPTEGTDLPGSAVDAVADAWEEGRDAVWADAVTAFARRITGDIGGALALEASCEAYVDSLRRS